MTVHPSYKILVYYLAFHELRPMGSELRQKQTLSLPSSMSSILEQYVAEKARRFQAARQRGAPVLVCLPAAWWAGIAGYA
jgi:hypothetical protein